MISILTAAGGSASNSGRRKFHAPISVSIPAEALHDAPDVFRTEEWFGSGGEAHRLTICTERLADFVASRGWRGIEFREVHEGGYSQPRRSFSGGGRAPVGE